MFMFNSYAKLFSDEDSIVLYAKNGNLKIITIKLLRLMGG